MIFPKNKSNEFQYTNNPSFFCTNLSYSVINSNNPNQYLNEIIKDGVVIYPEIISGNPLGAGNVVRYFLNQEGHLNGVKTNYSKNDFCLAYLKDFFSNSHAVLSKSFISPILLNHVTTPFENRKIDITYIGKGNKYRNCYRLKNTFEITREYPRTKEELSIILHNTRYFFSWDNISGTNLDAIVCGAKLVLLHDLPWSRDYIKNWNSEFGHLPFLNGYLQGDTVNIEPNPYYDELRQNLITNINAISSRWEENVAETATKIFLHFESQKK
jgi:hypothetical protein